jgi:hypothetical protein
VTKQVNRFEVAKVVAAVVAVCLAAVLVACQTTRQTRGVKPEGFLRNYSQLREGKGDEAQLIYISPSADWRAYDSIMIDSVSIWYSSQTEKLSAEDRKALTDLLYASLHKQLGQDYNIVNYPGPRTMRLRAAITEAKGARVVGNTLTTIVPQARLLSTLAGLATDTQVFVGKAAMEAEITDSMTGRRLAAAVDERAGAKTLRGLGGKWKDVDNAFNYWAEKIRKRLAELRAEA